MTFSEWLNYYIALGYPEYLAIEAADESYTRGDDFS